MGLENNSNRRNTNIERVGRQFNIYAPIKNGEEVPHHLYIQSEDPRFAHLEELVNATSFSEGGHGLFIATQGEDRNGFPIEEAKEKALLLAQRSTDPSFLAEIETLYQQHKNRFAIQDNALISIGNVRRKVEGNEDDEDEDATLQPVSEDEKQAMLKAIDAYNGSANAQKEIRTRIDRLYAGVLGGASE